MRYFGIAVVASVTASATLFCILYLIVALSAHEAIELAGLPLIASGHIAEMFQRREAAHHLATGSDHSAKTETATTTYEGFGLSPRRCVIFGVLMLIGVMELSSGYAGLVVGIFQGDESDRTALAQIGFTMLPISLIGAFFVGRWVGVRCIDNGLTAILLVIGITVVIEKLLVVLIDPSIIDNDVRELLLQLVVLFIGYSLIGLWGYWRGRRARQGRYLGYVLRLLPKDTREELVNLAYDEARRLAGTTAAHALQHAPAHAPATV